MESADSFLFAERHYESVQVYIMSGLYEGEVVLQIVLHIADWLDPWPKRKTAQPRATVCHSMLSVFVQIDVSNHRPIEAVRRRSWPP